MKHETKAQKTDKIERYSPDHGAKNVLGVEVERGAVTTMKWLQQQGRAPPVETICGYAPLVEVMG